MRPKSAHRGAVVAPCLGAARPLQSRNDRSDAAASRTAWHRDQGRQVWISLVGELIWRADSPGGGMTDPAGCATSSQSGWCLPPGTVWYAPIPG
jgi:hypothetical protein